MPPRVVGSPGAATPGSKEKGGWVGNASCDSSMLNERTDWPLWATNGPSRAPTVTSAHDVIGCGAGAKPPTSRARKLVRVIFHMTSTNFCRLSGPQT